MEHCRTLHHLASSVPTRSIRSLDPVPGVHSVVYIQTCDLCLGDLSFDLLVSRQVCPLYVEQQCNTNLVSSLTLGFYPCRRHSPTCLCEGLVQLLNLCLAHSYSQLRTSSSLVVLVTTGLPSSFGFLPLFGREDRRTGSCTFSFCVLPLRGCCTGSPNPEGVRLIGNDLRILLFWLGYCF